MIVIYGATMSPFVRKTLAFAAECGIAVESRAIGLGSKDAEFLAASPFRKIPALRDGDYTLCDSSAIVHYLDALAPEAGLIPTDAKARGKTIWYDEFADTILVTVAGKLFFNRIVAPVFLKIPGDLAAADKAEAEELPPILAYIEAAIPESGFLVEDRLTLADLAVASPFANLALAGHVLEAKTYPRLAAYVAAILARPGFAAMVAAEKQALGKA